LPFSADLSQTPWSGSLADDSTAVQSTASPGGTARSRVKDPIAVQVDPDAVDVWRLEAAVGIVIGKKGIVDLAAQFKPSGDVAADRITVKRLSE